MKNRAVFILFLALLSTSCQVDTFQLDDIIRECYDSKYQAEGYNIKTIIEDYEALLVREGVLKDGSGKSYLEVYRKIASDKDFRINAAAFQEYDPFFKVDNETKLALFECENEMTASAKEKDSKWRDIFVDSESAARVENPDQVYDAMIRAMSEEDLNSDYFRLKMFRLFDMVNANWGKSLTPPVSAQKHIPYIYGHISTEVETGPSLQDI